MPKVLHINCSCTGSTGKIIGDIADFLAEKGFETLLCAPDGAGNSANIRYYKTSLPLEQGLYRRLNRLYGYPYGFAPVSTGKIKRIIRKEKPDLLHIHCTNGFTVNVYALLRFIQKQGIPTVITNHAEFFYTGSCAHAYDCEKWTTGCGNCPRLREATCGALRDTTASAWRKMKDAFAGMQDAVMVSVSPWVGDRAARSPIVGQLPQAVILNGVNTEIFTYRDPAALRKKYGYDGDVKIVFHPTAHFSGAENDRKGGKHLLALAQMADREKVVFLVAGNHAENMDLPENVRLLGRITDQTLLAEYYAMADVTVITGARETFSMPVAESLCCGTPVAGFLAGGPESIAIAQYSHFCEQGDLTALWDHLSRVLSQVPDKQKIAQCAKKRYAAEVMAEQYGKIYNQLL